MEGRSLAEYSLGKKEMVCEILSVEKERGAVVHRRYGRKGRGRRRATEGKA